MLQEVQHNKKVLDAQKEAILLLQTISMESIATKETYECNEFELFCAMLVRAMLSDAPCIFIVSPFTLITTLIEIQNIIDVILKLEIKKDIIMLDIQTNALHYKKESCHVLQ